ncbi:MAG: transglutaminase domain-containing protein [Bacteroidales bacterium]|nr:transglutaminase domain-containing protein [Bacteroidales bacterium]
MKYTMISLLISILIATGCYAQKNTYEQADNSVLNFYLQYSSFTDPGEYEYMYENLPDSLPELCSLIRTQFIHPYAELQKYRELIPKERWNEMFRYPSVKSILEGLVSYDSSGLTKERKPEDRLVLGCWHNSILLASILKSRGIPARLRYGHATYIAPGYHISHTISEIWNEDEMRWMLVDPSMDMVDFSPDKFDFSNDAWLQLQRKEIDPNLYGIPGKYSGMCSIAAKVCGDLASVLGTEHTIFQYAPILDFIFEEDKQLTDEHIETLNRISELMKSLDIDNLSKLQEIYNNTPEIQMTKSFKSISENSSSNTGAKVN